MYELESDLENETYKILLVLAIKTGSAKPDAKKWKKA